MWPIYLSFFDVLKNSLDGHISEGGHSYDHLVGDDSETEPVHGFGDLLALEDLRSDVVWGSVERVWSLELFLFYQFAEIEVC